MREQKKRIILPNSTDSQPNNTCLLKKIDRSSSLISKGGDKMIFIHWNEMTENEERACSGGENGNSYSLPAWLSAVSKWITGK